jgi:hypothetical protein
VENPRSFVVRWRELDRWVVPNTALLPRALPPGWQRHRIGDVVGLVSNPVRVEPDAEYKLAGVKWYGEGVFHRETVLGGDSSAHYLSPLVPGALIYNRLFAWKTSFAIVPKQLDDCFVSNEFPQFIADASKVLPEYLYLWCINGQTIKAVNAASTGSAAVSRNRFREEYFLDFEIHAPPLPVQRKIVAVWEAARAQVNKSCDQLARVVGTLDAELRASARMQSLQRSCLIADWKSLGSLDIKSARASLFRLDNPSFKLLEDYAEEATELVKPWEEPDKDWPVYGVNNKEGVVFSHFQKGKDFNAPYKRIRKDWFFHNPTRSSVGSLGIVPDVPPEAITSPEYQVWKITEGLLNEYVATLIATPFFIELIRVHLVGAVKQRLYVDNLLQIPIPQMSDTAQRRIALDRERALQAVADAKARAETAKTDIDAMILGTKPVH